jgi:hypothetical protein
MLINNKEKVCDLLNNIGIALDLTNTQYIEVVKRYEAVATHLSKDSSLLNAYKPTILPQGSFLLGTMVKPIIEDDELDVDVVCRLEGKHSNWTQYDLKDAVRKQIEEDKTYKEMLDVEGRRCWTIKYHESTKFHMDILPSIVGRGSYELYERTFSSLNSEQVDTLAIRLTDNTLDNHRTETNTSYWPKSNPFGYAAWFKDRANTSTFKLISFRESVEPLPNHQVNKEPLIRVIQILKRHRDIMFGGEEHKPISIIITTLAAKAYKKETNVLDALLNILHNMESYIEQRYSNLYNSNIAWIGNPVNDVENFADKWPEEDKKRQFFYSWLEKAKSDFEVLRRGNLTSIYRLLKTVMGSRVINEAIKSSGIDGLISEQFYPTAYNSSLLNVSHRQKPLWPLALNYNVEIHGNYKDNNRLRTITPDSKVPKGKSVYFNASTNVPKPFEVYWQVVNTGEEANRHHGLRGNIFHSSIRGTGGIKQKDFAAYTGTHWIECFIVKDGVCVARSSEFIVNIN